MARVTYAQKRALETRMVNDRAQLLENCWTLKKTAEHYSAVMEVEFATSTIRDVLESLGMWEVKRKLSAANPTDVLDVQAELVELSNRIENIAICEAVDARSVAEIESTLHSLGGQVSAAVSRLGGFERRLASVVADVVRLVRRVDVIEEGCGDGGRKTDGVRAEVGGGSGAKFEELPA